MIKKILHMITLAILISSGILGFIKKQSYTDLRTQDNYLEQLKVAVMSEDLAVNVCQKMADSLPDCPIILRVTAISDVEHLFWSGRQKVRIEHIYRGTELDEGEEIYIGGEMWNLRLWDKSKQSVGCGFVNYLKQGTEYLIFSTGRIEGMDGINPVYILYDESILTPVFSYDTIKNVPIAIQNSSDKSVTYGQAKSNEFFGETDLAIESWENLKADMLDKFPR